MPSIARAVRPLVLLSLILALGACGGGGDGGSQAVKLHDRSVPFAGHWVGCWATGPTTTEKNDLHLVPVGAHSFTLTRTYSQYDNSQDCTGSPRLLDEEKSEVTLAGQTVTVGGKALEKFTRTGQLTSYQYPSGAITAPVAQTGPAPTMAFAGIVPGSAPELFIADDKTLDAQGVPRSLLPLVHIRQP